mmetsp:Transcript_2078/g.4024  ORF Transcript_2078/g.4024 Transcript_2078/m.4024 type:complete len:208 (+) Transcript_2078:528-1151(+)
MPVPTPGATTVPTPVPTAVPDDLTVRPKCFQAEYKSPELVLPANTLASILSASRNPCSACIWARLLGLPSVPSSLYTFHSTLVYALYTSSFILTMKPGSRMYAYHMSRLTSASCARANFSKSALSLAFSARALNSFLSGMAPCLRTRSSQNNCKSMAPEAICGLEIVGHDASPPETSSSATYNGLCFLDWPRANTYILKASYSASGR